MMNRVNQVEDDDKPLYLQIKDHVRSDIISGKYPLGSRLPSFRELSGQYECSIITTKRAYQDLAQEGYIRTSQGTGTFVVANEQQIARDKERLVTNAMLQAVDCGIKLNYSIDQLQVMFRNVLSRMS